MKHFVLTALLTLIAFPTHAADGAKESAYDRVMKTQMIRCAYGTSKPWIWQDLETDKMTGLNITLMEEVARQTNLKLEWPEETGWGEIPTSLYNGRTDVACSTMWNDPARGRQVAFTKPLFYTALYAWSAEGDNRFTGEPEEINNPNIRIAVQEGDINIALAQRNFPLAQIVAIPPTAPWSDLFLNVTTGKADITFVDSVAAASFNATNEKHLKRIPLPAPVAVYGNSLGVSIHESELKEILDTAISYMIQTGAIEALTADFRKQYPNAILLPQKPYERPH